MKSNESAADRGIRVVIGIVALVLAFMMFGAMDGEILGIVVAAVGVIAVLTGVVGFCPAYRLVGLSTCKKEGCCGGGDSCGCSKE